jgi:hypothetical protein
MLNPRLSKNIQKFEEKKRREPQDTELDQAVADIDDQQLSIDPRVQEAFDAKKLRNSLRIIDATNNYTEDQLERTFGEDAMRSITSEVPEVML